MDLVAKVFVIAVLIVVIIALIRIALQSTPTAVTKSQAITNITNYIHDAYGAKANVTITNVTASQYAGSWDILAGVITNGTTPCPSYFVLSFEYPFNTYNYRIQNNYTANCKVNEATIGSSPVAIAKSYSFNTSQVRNFVNTYGYSNVVVSAERVNQSVNGMNESVWAVYYNAPGSNQSVQVFLETNGTLITAT